MGPWPSYLLTGVVTGAFFAIASTGMQVVYGSTRILNFAQGQFVVLGMFTMWELRTMLGVDPWLTLLVVVLIGLLAGIAFYLICIRPFDGRPSLQVALVTLAAGITIQAYFALQFGADPKVVQPFISRQPFTIGSLHVGSQDLLVIGGAFLCLAVLFVIFRFTWMGLAMRATAENREGAEVAGISPRVVSLVAFAIGCAISAFAGALIAPMLGVSFDAGTNITLTAFVASTMGGLSSTIGAVTGGFVLGLSSAIIASIWGADFQAVWLLFVVIVLLYVRPHGILGRKVAEE